MADLLVRLYDLPPVAPLLEQLAESRLVVRRAHPREGPLVEAWVRQHFVKERNSGAYTYNILNALNAFDCKNKRVNLLQVEVFEDDKAVDAYTPSQSGGNRPVIPGTVEYFAYQYLCTTKTK